MQEVTIKKDNDVVLDDEIKIFLNPKFVFLPVYRGFKLKVRDKDYVYKDDIVAMNEKGRTITASVSGRVLGIKKMDYYKAKSVPSLVIENDFKENMRSRRSAKKYISGMTKREFLRILEDASYLYKGIYLDEKFRGEANELIINAVPLDPHFGNKYVILKESAEDILEMGDFLGEMMGVEKICLAIKNTDAEVINTFTSLLGTYPNIEMKFVTDAYPNGHEAILKRLLRMEAAVVVDIEELSCLYEILKRERPITSKYITVTGNAVKPKAVVRVKLGTLLSEVFVNNFDFTSPHPVVYINGFLYGEAANSLKCVADSDIDGVYIEEAHESHEEACLNCGQCSKTCPMGLNPKFVFDHDGTVESEYYEKCLQCGLCNYVCPAGRDLKSRMRGSDNS